MNRLLAIVRSNFIKVALPKHKFNFCLDVKSVSAITAHNDTALENPQLTPSKVFLKTVLFKLKRKYFSIGFKINHNELPYNVMKTK